jgi:hypothetical protein
MSLGHRDRNAPGGVARRLYHPVTPAVVLLAAAAAGAASLTLTGGRPIAAIWWLLVGLVSGYAISGSV